MFLPNEVRSRRLNYRASRHGASRTSRAAQRADPGGSAGAGPGETR